MFQTDLPIAEALPPLLAALSDHGRAVLQAPPGAGKTTIVPLALLQSGLVKGRILMLEPRRLAARSSAQRMADLLGEKLGETVGYRVRGDTKISGQTRIEVVTKGILTRMLQSDPSLDGVDAVLFDEFHERSLNADLGLALTWEVKGALREDLMVVVMSATLDAEPVAKLLDDAPIITSQGRAFPVTPIWLDRPYPKEKRFEHAAIDLIEQAVADTSGGVLVFLPGEGEIRRVAQGLNLPHGCGIRPLFGAMPFADQRRAIAPVPSGRKVVLATSIAETSLTIEDIRVVVDTGRARRARFDPASGMSKLVTEPVSKAEAAQRAGRAGRVAAGHAYKMWTKGADGALPAFAPAEIEAADLTSLALELAQWGGTADDLAFLTPPPKTTLDTATDLLHRLGALAKNRITSHGKTLAKIPTHPRLAHMIVKGGRDAAMVAALLSERDITRETGSDLSSRLRMIRDAKNTTVPAGARKRINAEAQRLSRFTNTDKSLSLGALAALAYPDRVGLRRAGDTPRFLLSGGKGAHLDPHDPLASQRLIVATDLDGDTRDAKIRRATPLSETDLRQLFSGDISWHNHCEWSKRDARVVARTQERFGAIALNDRIWKVADSTTLAMAFLDGVQQLGLSLSPAAKRFQTRVALARKADSTLPDLSDTALLDNLQNWLLPHVTGLKTAQDWQGFDCLPALSAQLDYAQTQHLNRLIPPTFHTPTGRNTPIDYSGDHPAISVRLQEMFGITTHPTVAGQPILVTLLSPAQRPLQTTLDIPGFWASSYADVRKDMRGRYPKHLWPEYPTQAVPTMRAKSRGA